MLKTRDDGFTRQEIEDAVEQAIVDVLVSNEVPADLTHARRLLRALVGIGQRFFLVAGGKPAFAVKQILATTRRVQKEHAASKGFFPQPPAEA